MKAPIVARITEVSSRIAQTPYNARLYLLRGEALFQKHDFFGAVRDLTYALELDGSINSAWFWRGMAYGRMGKVERGIEDLSIFIQRKPDSSLGYTKRGVRYLWIGDLDKAERDLTKAISLDPRNAEAHDDLGVIFARRGKTRLAIKHFQTTVSLDPSYQKGFHNLAMAYFLSGENEQALLAINKALEIKLETKNSLLLKGTILEAMGQMDDAKSVIEYAEFLPDGNWSERMPVK